MTGLLLTRSSLALDRRRVVDIACGLPFQLLQHVRDLRPRPPPCRATAACHATPLYDATPPYHAAPLTMPHPLTRYETCDLKHPTAPCTVSGRLYKDQARASPPVAAALPPPCRRPLALLPSRRPVVPAHISTSSPPPLHRISTSSPPPRRPRAGVSRRLRPSGGAPRSHREAGRQLRPVPAGRRRGGLHLGRERQRSQSALGNTWGLQGARLAALTGATHSQGVAEPHWRLSQTLDPNQPLPKSLISLPSTL